MMKIDRNCITNVLNDLNIVSDRGLCAIYPVVVTSNKASISKALEDASGSTESAARALEDETENVVSMIDPIPRRSRSWN
jgi:hypothetical protein